MSAGDSFASFNVCGRRVNSWRECGAGCRPRLVLAYCEDHGGDDRAAKEMAEHVAKDHHEGGA
jgi:hypothetical protein